MDATTKNRIRRTVTDWQAALQQSGRQWDDFTPAEKAELFGVKTLDAIYDEFVGNQEIRRLARAAARYAASASE